MMRTYKANLIEANSLFLFRDVSFGRAMMVSRRTRGAVGSCCIQCSRPVFPLAENSQDARGEELARTEEHIDSSSVLLLSSTQVLCMTLLMELEAPQHNHN